jgi:hypothetical protein
MSDKARLFSIVGCVGMLAAPTLPAFAAPADACAVFRAAALSDVFASYRTVGADVTFEGPIVARNGISLREAASKRFPELRPLGWATGASPGAAEASCDLTSIAPNWRADAKATLRLQFNQPVFLREQAIVEVDEGIVVFDDVVGATILQRFPAQLCIVSRHGSSWTNARCVDYPHL